MSVLGPVTSASLNAWTYEIDFTAPDALEQYQRAGIKCVRPEAAYYHDSNGIQRLAPPYTPRFDHDPITLEPLGLMVDTQRHNLLNNSEVVGGSGWFPYFGGVGPIIGGERDPFGGNKAFSFKLGGIGPVGTGGGLINGGYAGMNPAAQPFTVGMWIRCDQSHGIGFGFSDATPAGFQIGPKWQYIQYSRGWSPEGDTSRLFQLLISRLAGDNPEAKVYLFQPICTQGDRITTYIPTTAAMTTAAYRNNDFHQMPADPFMGGYNNEGAIFVEWVRLDDGQTYGVLEASDGAVTTYSYFIDDNGQFGSVNVSNAWNNVIYGMSGIGAPRGAISRAAITWYNNGITGKGGSVNGGDWAEMPGSAIGNMVGISNINLGVRQFAGTMPGYIRKVAFSQSFNPSTDIFAGLPTPNAARMKHLTA